jgi:deglycase
MDTNNKVAVLVDNYFEQAEFEKPISALEEAGAEVTVITSSSSKELDGFNHVEMGDSFTADLQLKDAVITDYGALVLPGGALNADKLRMDKTARTWVREFLEGNKPLAVICHAPWVLISAGLVTGRRLTSYFTIQDDIRNAGGKWIDERVVVDGNLITSRQPDDLPAFNEALISMLAQLAHV